MKTSRLFMTEILHHLQISFNEQNNLVFTFMFMVKVLEIKLDF